MSEEALNLRDALTDALLALADGQDQQARGSMSKGDVQGETAHRAAAVGLRMAAGMVSEELGRGAMPSHSSPGYQPAPACFGLRGAFDREAID